MGVLSLVLGAFLLVVGLLTAPALADDPVTEEQVVEEPVAETTVVTEAPVVTTPPPAPEAPVVTEAPVTTEAPGPAAAVPLGPSSSSSSSSSTTTGKILLKVAHVGSSNPGFQAEVDDRCPEGAWGWHFVIPQGSTTSFDEMSVTFENDKSPTGPMFYYAGSQVKHAYFFTSGPDTLLAASALVFGQAPLATEFNLSHVCNGASSSTSSSTGESSVSSSSTEQSSVESSNTERSFASSDDGALDEGVERDDGGVTVTPANVQTLPRTGSNSATAVTVGGLLLVLGLLLVRYGRPRKD